MSATRPDPPANRIADLNLRFGLLIVLLLAGVVRFLPLGVSAFPLNDGALFARMAGDLASNGFLLPTFTSYNGEAIPFAYPPLALYLTAILAQVSGGDAIEVLRWFPAMLATASVLAVYLVAAELLRSRWRGLIAAAAFAFMPQSYTWFIVGGGVTRALGLLLALLALHQGTLMIRRRRRAYIAGTAAFGGLTALAHPQATVFLAVSLLTLVAFQVTRGRTRYSITSTVVAAVSGLLVASPWLIAVISKHGLPTLLGAGRTGFDPGVGAGQLFGVAFADSPVFDLMVALGVLGILVRVARRQWMVPVWLLLTVVIDPRAGVTYATVPLAISVVPIIGEIFSRMVPVWKGSTTLESEALPVLLRRNPAIAILTTLMLFVVLRTAARTAASEFSPLHGLQPDTISAMSWIARNTDTDSSSFLVITNRDWASDYVSEWFPVLAGRTSLATVQGSEWRGFKAFVDRLAQYRELQDCATRTATCLDEWGDRWHQPPAYVFLPKGRLFGPKSPSDCCPALRETLAMSDRYRLIYDGPGATVFAPVTGKAAELSFTRR